MYRFTLLLIPMILLSSCTIDWNDEKDAKIVELNQKIEDQKEEIKKTKDDELFKKNKECANYKTSMFEDINNPTYTRYKLDPELNEIFYSAKRKSCIYVYENFMTESCLNLNLPNEDYIKYCTKEISVVDFLTKEILFVEDYNRREQFNKCFDEIWKTENKDYTLCDRFTVWFMISKLKWE